MAEGASRRARAVLAATVVAAGLATAGAYLGLTALLAPVADATGAVAAAGRLEALSQRILFLATRHRLGGPEGERWAAELAEAADAFEAGHAALVAAAEGGGLTGDRLERYRRLYGAERGGPQFAALAKDYALDIRTVLDGGEPAASDAYARMVRLGPDFLLTALNGVAALQAEEAAAAASGARRVAAWGGGGAAALLLAALGVLALRLRQAGRLAGVARGMAKDRDRIAALTKQLAASEWARRAAERARRVPETPPEAQSEIGREVRTALTGAIAMAELAQEEAEDETARRRLSVIRSACETLLASLPDLALDVPSGEDRAATPFSPTRLARRAQAAAAGLAGLRGVSLYLETDPDVGPLYLGDPERIRAVLVTLIDQVVSGAGGDSATLSIGVSRGGLRFTVADPESRLDGPQTAAALKAAPGKETNRPLASAARLAAKLGGAVEARPAGPDGLALVLSLPCAAAPEEEDVAKRRRGVGRRVLVADDNPINREAAALAIRQTGAEVVEAEDGRAALEALERAPVDLILMDMAMPRMDGAEAIRAIRDPDGPLSDAPIVALTADVSAGARERCLAVGADAYLPKPFEVGSLQALALELMKFEGPEADEEAGAAPEDAAADDADWRDMDEPAEAGGTLFAPAPMDAPGGGTDGGFAPAPLSFSPEGGFAPTPLTLPGQSGSGFAPAPLAPAASADAEAASPPAIGGDDDLWGLDDAPTAAGDAAPARAAPPPAESPPESAETPKPAGAADGDGGYQPMKLDFGGLGALNADER